MKTPAVILALLLAGGAAQAQSVNDADLCRAITNHPDLAIKHCSAAIDKAKASNDMLALWHVQRGVLWADKGDYERAIADHTAALKLDPKVRHANYYRGTAWSHKGEFDHAIADFDAAVKLSADDPLVYHARGVELTVKGDYPRALADFEKALQLDAKAAGVHFARGRTLFYLSAFARASGDLEVAFKSQPNVYTALWLFLARKRSGNHDADDLLERDTRGIRAGWPAPLIALYMGRTDVSSVMAGATSTEPNRQRELRCEAHFYVAQAHIVKGEPSRAQPLLQEVHRNCPKNLLEYEAATAELRRLK